MSGKLIKFVGKGGFPGEAEKAKESLIPGNLASCSIVISSNAQALPQAGRKKL